MQAQLDTTATLLPIQILGINAAGLESGNMTICAGRTLPWLQDTSGAEVWRAWAANTDEVFVLDSTNVVITVYSLFDHTLAGSANFATLKNMLITAAR